MRYLACLTVVPLALAGFVLADVPAEMSPDPLLLFQRDQGMIHALVEGGLRLASQNDPLRRAGTCNVLADQFSREIKQAAARKEGPRAVALAQSLKSLLVGGVAFNTSLARSTLPANGEREKALEGILRDTDQVTGPAEEGLKQLATSVFDNDWSILRPLEQGRDEVRRAIHGERPALILPGPKER